MPRQICATLKPFLAMDILAEANRLEAKGERVIHLEVGQPDFDTPQVIKEAALRALAEGKTGYTAANGILPLREAICQYYADHYQVKVSPEQILITPGTSPALMSVLAALCEPGDTVLTAGPTYACYDNGIRFAGASSIRVPCRADNGFQLEPDQAKAALQDSTRLLLINSPSNPCGSILAKDKLQELADLNVMLLSDEIYHGLTYGENAASALQVTDNCCVVDGFSKRYAMTGWRLGWLVAPQPMIQTLLRMLQNFFLCAPSFVQWAGVAALEQGWPEVERMTAEYDRRRQVMLAGLRKLGFKVESDPAGAFYILADARAFGTDSVALAQDILAKTKVGLTPGVDFGPEAEGYLRFSYANSVENIEEALERLGRYLSGLS